MDVGFHEPGEGLEIDERDGRGRRGISEEGLHTAAFLAVACERAFGVQGRGKEVIGLGDEIMLLGKHDLGMVEGWETVAASVPVWFLGLGYPGGCQDFALVRDMNADRLGGGATEIVGETGTFDGATKDLEETPRLARRRAQRITGVCRVLLGGIADHFVWRYWTGYRVFFMNLIHIPLRAGRQTNLEAV